MLSLPDAYAELWDWFHATGEPAKLVPQALDRPLLSRWTRARSLGATIDDTPGKAVFLDPRLLQARQDKEAALLSRAEELLGAAAFVELRRRGFTIVVTDSDGIILRAWGGEALEAADLEKSLGAGARWDEVSRGTNAIGTALAERTACSVVGSAHYSVIGRRLCCYASLVQDPYADALAVLDISGPAHAADPLMSVLAQGLACGIESDLRARYTASRERELSGIVAHELKGPLSTMSLSAIMLERASALSPEAELKPIGVIAQAVKRMGRIIDDLLDAAALEAGQFALRKQPLDPAELVREALSVTGPLTSALTVRAEVEEALPRVDADRDRVVQIFANLIGNAAKFTPQGGEISVGARREAASVRFWVSDSGKGLSPDQARHVFDRFWQAERGDRRGAGLGLFITRRLVEEHGGGIWVESRPGAGAMFAFTLPTALSFS